MSTAEKIYSMNDFRDPDFLYIGYEKAASTFLKEYLEQHPDVYLDPWIANYALRPLPQEPTFYDEKDIRNAKEAKVLISAEERLCESILFKRQIRWSKIRWDEGQCPRILDYLSVDPEEMAQRWKEKYPRVKIIIVIRDQVEWLSSLYRYFVSELQPGKRRFRDFCATPRGMILLRAGQYDLTIDAYISAFGKAQVKVLRYEWLVNDYERFMKDICGYLGIDWIRRENEPINVGRSAETAYLLSKLPFAGALPHGLKSLGRQLVSIIYSPWRYSLRRSEQEFIRSFYKLSNLKTEKTIHELTKAAQ